MDSPTTRTPSPSTATTSPTAAAASSAAATRAAPPATTAAAAATATTTSNAPGRPDQQGPFRNQSVGRDLRFWPTFARLHQAEDCGVGALRGEAVRHIQDTPGLQRMCFKDLGTVSHSRHILSQ